MKPFLPGRIDGCGFYLRFPLSDDAPYLYRAMQDSLIVQSLSVRMPYTLRMAEESISRESAKRSLSGSYTWAVISDGGFSGEISLIIYEDDRRAELGYWLAPWARGCGLMSRAVRLLIDTAFKKTMLNRIYAIYTGGNIASGAVLDRAQMRTEGVLREHRMADGQFQDIVYRGILRREWEKLYGGGI